MKKIITAAFILLSLTAAAEKESHHSKKAEYIENLSTEQKEKLLSLKREYFSELKDIQIRFKELRKEANHCMMNNDETKYEKIHDEMNKLKLEREMLKQSYRVKIEKVLNK